MTKLVVGGMLAFALMACVPEDVLEDGEDIAEIAEPLVLMGGMTTNAMATNAMATNAMTTNGGVVASGVLVSTPLSQARWNSAIRSALDDSNARIFMEYVVGCALSRSQSVVLESASGWTKTVKGELGLATSWRGGTCGVACQEWVTGCLLARTNHRAIQMRIMMRQHPNVNGPLSARSPLENSMWVDGAFYGNMFSASYKKYAAAGLQYKLESFEHRFCSSGNPGCPVYVTGWMWDDTTACSDNWLVRQSACTGVGAPDYIPSSCQTRNECAAPGVWYGRVISALRPFSEVGIVTCSSNPSRPDHCEHIAGIKLDTYRSVCTWHVIANMGDTYCRDTSWDAECVRKAKTSCGSHNLCTTGDPLVMGDSGCIDIVCNADPYCCTAGASWDSVCVNEARTMCPITCP